MDIDVKGQRVDLWAKHARGGARSLPMLNPEAPDIIAPLTLDLDALPDRTGMTRKDYLPFGKPNFSEKEIRAVAVALRSGWIGMGPATIAFENELAEYVRAPFVVTVDSCTSALFLSLLVSGVRQGDEVICPSLTWCSTANAALYAGAKPIFCDIDADSLCLTPDSVLAKVTRKTKAVVVVHFGGLAVDVAALRSALPRRIAIIEDAAHALGARYANNRPVGSSGNLTCFSFYANKNLSTGEGGAIALHSRPLAERLRSLRQHALPINAWKRFSHPRALLLSNQLTELGYKMNYTDLHAVIGRVQLARQEEFGRIRSAIVRCYVNGLKQCANGVRFQKDCLDPRHARHLFVIRLPLDQIGATRERILLKLRKKLIGASIHYSPLHLMPLYNKGRRPPTLPVTERVAREIVTLPLSASMNEADARYVLTHLLKIILHSWKTA